MEGEPVGRSSREVRLRRGGVVAAVGAVGVLVALVSTVAPGGEGGPGQGEVDGPLRVSDGREVDGASGDPREGDVGLDLDPVERSVPARVFAMWPFEQPRMVLFEGAQADAGDLEALAADVAAHDDVAQARRLDVDAVRARVGQAQAERLLAEGAGAAVADVPGGASARTTAHAVLGSGDGGSGGRAEEARSERPTVAGARLAVCWCRTARRWRTVPTWSAWRPLGATRGRRLPRTGSRHRCRPRGPCAVGGHQRRPSAGGCRGQGGANGSRSRVTGAAWDACVRVFSVRAKSRRGCGEASNGFGGLTGLGGNRHLPVLAGVAPQGSVRVTANGQTLAAAGQADDVRLFAGAAARW